jgi:hypothetical protein
MRHDPPQPANGLAPIRVEHADMDFGKYLRACPCGSEKKFASCCKPKRLDNVIQSPEDVRRDRRPDWRIAVIAQIAEDIPPAYPGGPAHPKGSYVSLIHQAKHPSLGYLSFTTPHATALALNVAVRSASNATSIKQEIQLQDIPSPSGRVKRVHPDELFFTYIEDSMTSVNFSFQALETYCNSVMARTENFTTFAIKTKEGDKTYDRKQVERYCSTEDKLLQVLPVILQMQNPKSSLQWHHFKKLKKIRDDIVHMKSRDMYSNAQNDSNTLFFELFDYHPLAFPKFAFELIWLYCQTSVPRHHQPYWTQRFIDYLGKEIEKHY